MRVRLIAGAPLWLRGTLLLATAGSVVGASALVSGCAARSVERKEGNRLAVERASARVEVVMPRRIRADSAVPLTVRISNQSDDSLWVNTKMLLKWNNGDSYGQIRLDIRGPDGGALEFGCQQNINFKRPGTYVVLKPGERVEGEVASGVLRCFDGLAKPGAYRLGLTYRDGSMTVPDAPTGAVHLSGELVAPPVEFEVVAADAGVP